MVPGTKPFIEVSIVERVMEHSKVRQYKYCKVLIQEFHVKLDMGLINALVGMFPQKLHTEQEAVRLYHQHFQADNHYSLNWPIDSLQIVERKDD